MDADERECIALANEILSNKERYVILDTETTGLYDCEIVQIAITNLDGLPLLDSFVKPLGEITPGAIAIHSINKAAVKDAPSFAEIHHLIQAAIQNKIVLIYNASFDDGVLAYCCKLNSLDRFVYNSYCVMELYSKFVGEIHPYYGNYKWQKLPGGDHTAYGDCRATLDVIKCMAETSLEPCCVVVTDEDDDIPY